MGKIKYVLWGIAMLGIILGLSGCNGEKVGMTIIVEGPVNVYSDYPESGMPIQEKVIAVISKDETCSVLHVRHSKDFQFYKIQLKDGREGYVQFGDKFRIISKTK